MLCSFVCKFLHCFIVDCDFSPNVVELLCSLIAPCSPVVFRNSKFLEQGCLDYKHPPPLSLHLAFRCELPVFLFHLVTCNKTTLFGVCEIRARSPRPPIKCRLATVDCYVCLGVVLSSPLIFRRSHKQKSHSGKQRCIGGV
jgi:hypothetical protein